MSPSHRPTVPPITSGCTRSTGSSTQRSRRLSRIWRRSRQNEPLIHGDGRGHPRDRRPRVEASCMSHDATLPPPLSRLALLRHCAAHVPALGLAPDLPAGTYVTLAVGDDGAGMDAATQVISAVEADQLRAAPGQNSGTATQGRLLESNGGNDG